MSVFGVNCLGVITSRLGVISVSDVGSADGSGGDGGACGCHEKNN